LPSRRPHAGTLFAVTPAIVIAVAIVLVLVLVLVPVLVLLITATTWAHTELSRGDNMGPEPRRDDNNDNNDNLGRARGATTTNPHVTALLQ